MDSHKQPPNGADAGQPLKISSGISDGNVILSFSTPVSQIALNPDAAINFVVQVITAAQAARQQPKSPILQLRGPLPPGLRG